MLNTSASSARVRSDVFEYEYGMTGGKCHKGPDEQAAYRETDSSTLPHNDEGSGLGQRRDLGVQRQKGQTRIGAGSLAQ